ncbi:hypothetical protein [Catonella massiliensis]|uniref:Uncharacterized protein n=1 Tax=Catonella massiliensis TaxID=2799636 RepID=A0ABS1J3H0_9FIRM|nr:hypothetical protein [Catonella massiliensis]MBK5898676.1 hypothetical protein [Catonella massiliensis]
MSWAEVSKVNGDFLNASLDIKMHLTDYKMHGKKSYVFQIKDLLHGIYECTYISMNDQDINGEALEYLLKNNKHAGETLTQIFDLGRKDEFKTLRTMQAVASSSTAMQAVLASSTAMQAVLASSTAMQAVLASSTAMQAVLASSTAMQAVASSSTAITEIFKSSEYIEKMLTIMGKSKVALNTFKSSETIMIKFNKLSDVLRAKFADEVEKRNINHEYYTSGHIIQTPTLLCEYTNGAGYTGGGAGAIGKSTITLVGESAQLNISVKNKFITDFDYNRDSLVSNNFGYPQYCKNVSIICA